MSVILSAENLVKTFPLTKKQQKVSQASAKRFTALDNLSFSVNQGEIFGLLGPNGAGKTTAMRIISTLIKCDSGDAFVEGISIKKHAFEIRRKIGFLSGDLKLEDFFTPAYLFDFFSSLRDVPQKQIKERRELLFSRFGIDEYAHKKLYSLSTGMRQKVSFVVSISHDPSIIIFDEPTNGMDLVASRTVTEFLLELKKQGKTIILSTHIFSLAEKICDCAGFIINGKMLRCGTLNEVAYNGDCMRGVHTPPLWGEIKGMYPESNSLPKQPYPVRSAAGLVDLEKSFFNIYDNIAAGTFKDTRKK